MAKVSWTFFSSRRGITPQGLVSRGVVRDYETYLKYCQDLDVGPLSQADFEKEFSCIRSSAEEDRLDSVPAVKRESDDSESAPADDRQSSGLVAALWLAGVDDSGTDTPSPKLNQKPKKDKRRKAKSTSDEVD